MRAVICPRPPRPVAIARPVPVDGAHTVPRTKEQKGITRLSALRTASRQCTMLLLLPLALGSITTATVGSDRTPTPEQLLYQQREVSGAGLAM